ncbi:hypothetical protein [Nitrosophilus alvini]|uniref:hypothetical protein n=1 Tax=Nitrosophilus alvini TaxID=2714855 RepID=UPI00190B23F6|nr:hypothetical protein [Nitrosophilus alvini]
MKNLESILDKLIELLELENRYLIKTVSDSTLSEELLKTVEEKQKLLSELAAFEKNEIEPYMEKIEKIDELSKRNMSLAQSNLNYIEELFESIFEENSTKQYTKEGEIHSKKEGLFNKKI